MRDHLGELSMLGIASRTERNRGESGGRYYEYLLTQILISYSKLSTRQWTWWG
ncbi:hypothetical protein [Halostagnicola kamekurae]|uniref:hypothetical protein n=1 Tax=Halostagnicola kamekurae TaxID=619731 RepID=UPI001FE67861|nr:hypothetical protein [Halostagnicola kamekurae]